MTQCVTTGRITIASRLGLPVQRAPATSINKVIRDRPPPHPIHLPPTARIHTHTHTPPAANQPTHPHADAHRRTDRAMGVGGRDTAHRLGQNVLEQTQTGTEHTKYTKLSISFMCVRVPVYVCVCQCMQVCANACVCVCVPVC